MTALRELRPADLPALLALQHAFAGDGPRWSMAELRANLYDAGRDHGRRVVVVERDGEVLGGAGWVEAGPWCYGAPVVAVDDEVARALVAHVLARAYAIGASHIRITATRVDAPKRTALTAAGFEPIFDLVTAVREVRAGEGVLWEAPWARLGHAELDLPRLLDVHNETFQGVPNAPALSPAELRDQLDDSRCDPALTAAWVGPDGRYLAFVMVSRDHDDRGRFVTDDAIGVREEVRGRGIARAILSDLVARAADEVDEVRALIASTNASALVAHAAAGFAERSRSRVFQLDL